MFNSFLVCSEISADFLLTEDFEPRKKLMEDDIILIPMSDYIPASIRKAGIYPSYLKGYNMVFGAIAEVSANNSPTMLSKESVLFQLNESQFTDNRCIQHYLTHGGTIEHALSAVVHRSWEEVTFC